MYYLRGVNVYESDITTLRGLPYYFNDKFKEFIKSKVQPPYTADNVLGAIGSLFAPNLGASNLDRDKWCSYFAGGVVGSASATMSFPVGTPVHDIGYWNMLYDQLGDEGFDYSADGTGYTSNVINWNAADAMQANNDYSSSVEYKRLDGGYGLLFDALANEIRRLAASYPGSGIYYGRRLFSLAESQADDATKCTFFLQSPSGPIEEIIHADHLFLAMPRRSLELVAQNCAPTYMLNDDRVKYYLESSVDQPAVKVVMIFDEAWWVGDDCKNKPKLVNPTKLQAIVPPQAQWVGGDTITDLPLRMIYYFGNNIPGGPGLSGGPYVLLASYDDMNYTGFWRELELTGDYKATPSLINQPLNGPTAVPVESALGGILREQLADAHGIDVNKIIPKAIYFQDWGQDPFGGGYHGWAAHYNFCQAMDVIRAPYHRILNAPARKTYIVGSCYSFDQSWVEGAFCTAESVLQDFLGLGPLNPSIKDYKLVCST
jgi:hypothetical protein